MSTLGGNESPGAVQSVRDLGDFGVMKFLVIDDHALIREALRGVRRYRYFR